ncbi:hypothetical protein [Embleya sp. MST-111070]|uniref:hypothetical protein n=1 Tax=Embleya sp. MST-111070 TaxID=3398231 RepID=UPI003F73B02C
MAATIVRRRPRTWTFPRISSSPEWKTVWAQAGWDLLGAPAPHPTPAQPRRVLVHGTGARRHPYADLQPPGRRSADLSRYGHRSRGSAG